jgi:tripartite ATP-independent transporter DctM subunit
MADKIGALRNLWPILLLLVVVFTSLYSGFVTITEAAGISALGAFLIPLAMGRLNFVKVHVSLRKALVTTTMIFSIIICATFFGYYLTLTQVTSHVVSFISNLAIEPSLVILLLVVLYVFLGFFMDQVAILFLTLPLSVPIVENLGFDVYWFAILIVAASETGLVTPPVGLNCYVASSAADEPLEDTFAGVVPFLFAEFAVIALLFSVPWLTLVLI